MKLNSSKTFIILMIFIVLPLHDAAANKYDNPKTKEADSQYRKITIEDAKHYFLIDNARQATNGSNSYQEYLEEQKQTKFLLSIEEATSDICNSPSNNAITNNACSTHDYTLSFTVNDVNLGLTRYFVQIANMNGNGSYPAELDSASCGQASVNNPFFTEILDTPYISPHWFKLDDTNYFAYSFNYECWSHIEYDSEQGTFSFMP